MCRVAAGCILGLIFVSSPAFSRVDPVSVADHYDEVAIALEVEVRSKGLEMVLNKEQMRSLSAALSDELRGRIFEYWMVVTESAEEHEHVLQILLDQKDERLLLKVALRVRGEERFLTDKKTLMGSTEYGLILGLSEQAPVEIGAAVSNLLLGRSVDGDERSWVKAFSRQLKKQVQKSVPLARGGRWGKTEGSVVLPLPVDGFRDLKESLFLLECRMGQKKKTLVAEGNGAEEPLELEGPRSAVDGLGARIVGTVPASLRRWEPTLTFLREEEEKEKRPTSLEVSWDNGVSPLR